MQLYMGKPRLIAYVSMEDSPPHKWIRNRVERKEMSSGSKRINTRYHGMNGIILCSFEIKCVICLSRIS